MADLSASTLALVPWHLGPARGGEDLKHLRVVSRQGEGLQPDSLVAGVTAGHRRPSRSGLHAVSGRCGYAKEVAPGTLRKVIPKVVTGPLATTEPITLRALWPVAPSNRSPADGETVTILTEGLHWLGLLEPGKDREFRHKGERTLRPRSPKKQKQKIVMVVTPQKHRDRHGVTLGTGPLKGTPFSLERQYTDIDITVGLVPFFTIVHLSEKAGT